MNSELRIACQNRRQLLSWEKGEYNGQIVTFARLKNAPNIAAKEGRESPASLLAW